MIGTVELEDRVIGKGLCVNCGACEGMCPYWHSYRGYMMHDFECNSEEGRCVSFCPRTPVNIKVLRERFFDTAAIIDEIGPFLGLYLVRAADPGIRAGSQHGGAMTALTELALKEGFIDAAVLTKSEGGLSPKGMLAASPDEIRACRGSSFQIPASLAVLNTALKEGRYKKLGVVGTPCKTLAVYKMMSKPFPERDNNADNISMIFGLFCGWGLDWDGMEALVSRNAGLDSVSSIDIPPSKYHCMTLDGSCGTIDIDLDEVIPLVRQNCRYCVDMTAEFADISIGGARSADGWATDKGWNQVIVRTDKGMSLIDIARRQGVLEFKEVPEDNLERLKKASLNKKRTGISNIAAMTGDRDNLSYLSPSSELFRPLL